MIIRWDKARAHLQVGTVDNIPLFITCDRELPPELPGTYFIVPVETAFQNPHRKDFLYEDEALRLCRT